MADLDDLREGANFGLDIASQQQHFHVKGAENAAWGMKDRLSRILTPKQVNPLCWLATTVLSWGLLQDSNVLT